MKRSTNKLLACAAVLSGGLAFYGCGRSQTSTTAQENPGSTASPSGSANRMTLSSDDADFIQKATKGGLAEVELGRLAQQKAASDVVKQFGRRMEQDHSKANQELRQLASSKGVAIPQSLDDKDAAERDRLAKLSGREFDVEYVRDMVKDHKEDVSEFKREANQGQDPDVRAFASKMLPILEDHLRTAEQDEKMVRSGRAGS